jgi:RNA 2',3'-cyclic 3'-phosphodiesterase
MTSPNLRLFLGVKPSLDAIHALTRCASAMRALAAEQGVRARWVAPASYHVTLKFLGWSRPGAVDAIRDAVRAAVGATPRFEIGLRGVGAFPEPGRARVIWAGVVDPAGHLSRLAAIVDETLAGLGYPRDERGFHAHVTLARVRELADVGGLLVPWSEQEFSKTSVSSVTLYESEMKSTGSEYLVRAEMALESGSEGGKRQTRGLKRPHRDSTDVPGRPAPEPEETDDGQ